VALTRGYLYNEDNTLLEQRLIVESDGTTASYHFWHHCYDEAQMRDILGNQGFVLIRSRNDILPPGHYWTGENIQFYAARKI
jgi:very-short-patch-repair endonuclease